MKKISNFKILIAAGTDKINKKINIGKSNSEIINIFLMWYPARMSLPVYCSTK